MNVKSIEAQLKKEFASITERIPKRLVTLGCRGREGMELPEYPGRAITLDDFERHIAPYKGENIDVHMLAETVYAMNMVRGDKKSRREAEKIMKKYPRE